MSPCGPRDGHGGPTPRRCVRSATVERCDQCGFVYSELPLEQVASALHALAVQYRARLQGTTSDALRRRPAPEVWSPLEYAAHVRDVLGVQRGRVIAAQHEDRPVWPSMRPEALVAELRYNDQDPGEVASDLEAAARAFAETLEQLTAAGWTRTGVYTWPVVASRDVLWVGRHTVHELVHHLFDMARTLQHTPGSASG